MTAGVADVFCIAQITYIVINNVMFIDNRWFGIFYFEIIANLQTGGRLRSSLLLKSERCLFAMLISGL